eukprot:CAMPEP_0114140738 /NCGR_PEP_ID=MMETSP0043_2-20121206/17544_1 /TAXON_ID=464988 /ORGANISM="Hemiselmis andersenii, Strain CCMP644" /LENGTH=101 /DNA_ID=CAMNT_0001234851 /DNA_START=168 /DNA_END=470 /DNA_ORIENTATION=+
MCLGTEPFPDTMSFCPIALSSIEGVQLAVDNPSSAARRINWSLLTMLKMCSWERQHVNCGGRPSAEMNSSASLSSLAFDSGVALATAVRGRGLCAMRYRQK